MGLMETTSDICKFHFGSWGPDLHSWEPQFSLCPSVSSVTQPCPTLCNPMDCSTPGLPIHHRLPEPTQTHVHQVGDVIQPSHPLPFYKQLFFQLSLGWTYSNFVLNPQSRNLIPWQQATHAPAAAPSSPLLLRFYCSD